MNAGLTDNVARDAAEKVGALPVVDIEDLAVFLRELAAAKRESDDEAVRYLTSAIAEALGPPTFHQRHIPP